MVDRSTDQFFMQRALELAAKGRGLTGTNPLVGAVLVRNGRIIGEGYHRRFGSDHAEIVALKNASEPVDGADLYVSLEPCSHHGKTPPCVDTLKAYRLKRVITAMSDPNPIVNGSGLAILRDSGISVESDVERPAAEKINKAYLKYVRTGLPYVILKIAQTLDGKIADSVGNSKWITSAESRKRVHLMRSQVDAVLIGAGTARQDNPSLTAHDVSENNPKRIVISSGGKPLPGDLELLAKNNDHLTIIAGPENKNCVTSFDGDPASVDKWGVKSVGKRVDLEQLLRMCSSQHLGRVLVEGGAALFSQFLESGLADEVVFVIAPKLLGGGLPAFTPASVREISNTLRLKTISSFELGGDVWIETEVVR